MQILTRNSFSFFCQTHPFMALLSRTSELKDQYPYKYHFFVLEIMDELSANWRIGSGSKYIEEQLSLCNIISTNPQFSGLASPSQSVQNSWKRKFRPHSLKLPTLPGNLESSTPCGVSSILFLLVIH